MWKFTRVHWRGVWRAHAVPLVLQTLHLVCAVLVSTLRLLVQNGWPCRGVLLAASRQRGDKAVQRRRVGRRANVADTLRAPAEAEASGTLGE